MKIAVLIPDRGDRPKFLRNCLRMVDGQTMKPNMVCVVGMDEGFEGSDIYVHVETEEGVCDITKRYRVGYDTLREKGLDCILLMENDDWYDPDYIKTMVSEWERIGRPDLLGQTSTIYYHLRLFSWFTMHHTSRSSAMNTLIKADLELRWPVDEEPYTDIWLWNLLKGVVFKPEKLICMGMKHGEGLCGGRSHVEGLHRYNVNLDNEKVFLKEHLDKESFEFYANYFNN